MSLARRALLTPSESSDSDYYISAPIGALPSFDAPPSPGRKYLPPIPLTQAHSLNAPSYYGGRTVISSATHEDSLPKEITSYPDSEHQLSSIEPETRLLSKDIACDATVLLFVAYSVHFTRYSVATGLSAFFPQKANELGLSEVTIGLIFTSFPVGVGCASMLGRRYLLRIGTRRAVSISLLFTSLFSLLFGFTPDLFHQRKHRAIMFFIFFFLNGLFGGFAECGTTIMLTQQFQSRVGVITVLIGTVCGLGCMAGPLFAGLLYSATDDKNYGFRLPFIFLCAGEVALSLLVLIVYTEIRLISSQPSYPKISKLFTLSRTCTFITIALSGTFIGSLDPTLAFRLEEFDYNERMVGTVFMVSSIAYVLFSLPTGWIIDSLPADSDPHLASRVLKVIQAVGMCLFSVAFLMLGPVDLGGGFFPAMFNNEPCVWIAVILKGIASNGMNAGYPDLIIGVDDSNGLVQATISALWNASYALGWALGPVTGGILVSFLSFNGYCTVISLVALSYGCVLIFFLVPIRRSFPHRQVQPIIMYSIKDALSQGTESSGWQSWVTKTSAYSFKSHTAYR